MSEAIKFSDNNFVKCLNDLLDQYMLHIFSQNALYFVPSLSFNHFLLNILKIINTFVPKQQSFTTADHVNEKSPFFCFETPPLPLLVLIDIDPHKNSISILYCKQNEKYPNNKISKLG